jgi:hypothetical protein
VDEQDKAALEADDEILAATLDRRDALAFELGGNRCGLMRADEARIENLDALEAASGKHGREVRANRLDLGQLRH